MNNSAHPHDLDRYVPRPAADLSGQKGVKFSSAKIPCNPLKRPVSDERIQGNPNFSNPQNRGLSRSNCQRPRKPKPTARARARPISIYIYTKINCCYGMPEETRRACAPYGPVLPRSCPGSPSRPARLRRRRPPCSPGSRPSSARRRRARCLAVLSRSRRMRCIAPLSSRNRTRPDWDRAPGGWGLSEGRSRGGARRPRRLPSIRPRDQ